MRSRKAISLLAIAAVSVATLVACSSGTKSPSGGGKVTLEMWGFSDLSKPLVSQYEKAHPGVTIRTKISDYDAAHQALLTALASGRGPDIAQIAIDYMGEFVAHSPTFALATGKKYLAATHKKFTDSGKAVFRAESNQGDLKYVDATGKPIYDTSQQIKQAWADGISAIKDGLSDNVATFTPQWDAALANGGIATLIAPAWMLTQIVQQAPKTNGKWNIAKLPGGAGNDGGSFLAIPKHAAHAKEAYDFISWLEAPAQQLALFKENQTFPSTPALYSNPAVLGMTNPFFGAAQIGKIYIASVEAVKPHPVGPNDRIIENQFENGIGRVDQGIQAPDAAWTQTMSDVKRELQ